jgi:hypothetical protein
VGRGVGQASGVTEVLERGDVQFFFRPLVQAVEASAHSLGVQSFFLVLSPIHGSHRRIRIGKKRMPTSRRERFWSRVERVGSLQRVLGDTVEPEVYATKTRGQRYQPGARPISRGTYELVLHREDGDRNGEHVHFRWDAEPFAFEDAPEEIALAEGGDHLVLFENTRGGRAVWTHEPRIADLDREGTEIVIVGPSERDTVRVAA